MEIAQLRIKIDAIEKYHRCTYETVPDECLLIGRTQNEYVVRGERSCDRFVLIGAHIIGACATHAEQMRFAWRIVGDVRDQFSFEDFQKVAWLIALGNTHLQCCIIQFAIQLRCVNGCARLVLVRCIFSLFVGKLIGINDYLNIFERVCSLNTLYSLARSR